MNHLFRLLAIFSISCLAIQTVFATNVPVSNPECGEWVCGEWIPGKGTTTTGSLNMWISVGTSSILRDGNFQSFSRLGLSEPRQVGNAHSGRDFDSARSGIMTTGNHSNRSPRSIYFSVDRIGSSLYSSAIFKYLAVPGTEYLREGDKLRQVRTESGFTDITSNADGFTLRVWPIESLTNTAKTNGFYTSPATTPNAIYTFKNPDHPALNNRLLINVVENFSGTAEKHTTTLYDQSNPDVLLITSYDGDDTSGTLLTRETLTYSDRGTRPWDYTLDRKVEEASNVAGVLGALKLVRHTLELYRDDSIEAAGGEENGKRLLSLTVAPGTAEAQTTTYDFYQDPANKLIHGRPKSIQRPDGSWESWEFSDAENSAITVERKYSSWKDVPMSQKENARKEETIITKYEATRTVSIAGQIIGKTRWRTVHDPATARIDYFEEQWDGADWHGTRTTFASATSATVAERGRPVARVYADGTGEAISYQTSGTDLNVTTRRGALQAIPAAAQVPVITAGTQTIDKYNVMNQVISTTTSDIASGQMLEFVVATETDQSGRPKKTVYNSDPDDYTIAQYGCCGLEFSRARDGSTVTYYRDGLKRVYRTIAKASSTAADLITSTNYDGLTTKTTRSQGSTTVLVSENTRTLGGLTDTQKSPDADGDSEAEISTSVTSYPAGGGTQTVNTAPDGTTTASLTFTDGDSKSSTDQEGHVTTFDKGTHSLNGGGLWSQTIAANTTQWTKSYSDPLGRSFKTEYADGAVQTMTYYPFDAALGSRGKPLSSSDPDENANPGTGSTATYFYNVEGEQIKTTTPLPGGNTLTQETETDVINSITIKGTVIAPAVRSISKTNGIITATSYRSVGGGEQIAASVTLSGESLTIQTRPTNGAWTSTSISPDGQKSIQTYTQGRPDKSEVFDNQNNLLHTTTQTYGDLNRLVSTTDSRTGAVTYNGYLENGSVTSMTSNNGSDTTASIYDKMGRVITTTLPDSSTTHTSYTPRGQVLATWGSQTYACLNLYDALGRMTELRTYQDLAHGTEPTIATTDFAATQWIFSAQRGFLVEKNYHGETDDGTTDADYSYTASGRLKTRTWERGITTTYTYQNGQQTSIDYSDATPDVTFVYDSFGRPSEITQANQSKHSFAYDPAKLVLTQETIEYDFNKDGTANFTRTLDRSHDNHLRPTGYQLKNGTTVENSAAYTFDDLNRLSTVSDGTNTFTYAYLAQAPGLVQSVTGAAHTVTNTYEPHRNILIRKQNSVVSVPSVVSQFDYTSNNLGQRTGLSTTGTAFAAVNTINWTYNPVGEVINADHSNNTFDQSWNFDGIGNRKTATDTNGATTYTTNPWNQYTAITGQPIGRTQDADGNLTSGVIPADLTANSTLAWDAENRLIKLTKPNGDIIDYQYDYQSRRIAKKVTAASIVTTHTAFVYDDWNPIGEYTVTANLTSTLTKSYLWGMDLSGSMQGAGGVGGLLSVHQHGIDPNNQSPITNNFFPTFDGNGNVSEYLSATGTVVAHYEYDAFGNTIVKTGALADNFTHRFSTKPLDAETGLYNYGFRLYNPNTGRWESRDPIEEDGGMNLYGFVGNDGVNYWDEFGLWAGPNRKNESKAEVCAEKGDTWETLSKIVGMKPSEVSKWVTGYTPKPIPGKTYQVPNTIVAYWGGDLNNKGRTLVNWNGRISQLKKKGFKIDEHIHKTNYTTEIDKVIRVRRRVNGRFNTWSTIKTYKNKEIGGGSEEFELQRLLEKMSKSADLHGMYVHGHGAPWGLFASETGSLTDSIGRYTRQQQQIDYKSLRLKYKMGFVWNYVCYANSGKPYLYSNSPGGEWKPDVDGVLCPLPGGGALDLGDSQGLLK